MSYGARQYQRMGDVEVSSRAIEIAVLRDINRALLDAADGVARIQALHRNHRVWSAFVKDAALSSNPLPEILKRDLTALGLFSMQYSTLAISQPLRVAPLVEINEQIIEGLLMQASAAVLPLNRAGPGHAAAVGADMSA